VHPYLDEPRRFIVELISGKEVKEVLFKGKKLKVSF
jgi:hypothetical protein